MSVLHDRLFRSKTQHGRDKNPRKLYQGQRLHGDVIVTVNGNELNARLDLASHSPTGFEWGYGGSGPAQLALAILADFTGNDSFALSKYQAFKFAVIAKLPRGGWTLSSEDIASSLAALSK